MGLRQRPSPRATGKNLLARQGCTFNAYMGPRGPFVGRPTARLPAPGARFAPARGGARICSVEGELVVDELILSTRYSNDHLRRSVHDDQVSPCESPGAPAKREPSMSVKQRTAAELMTKNPIRIAPTATLRAAALIISQQKLHCLLVPGEDGRCVGVITSKDIVQILCEGEVELLDQLRVADAMTRPAITVQQEFLIVDCLRLMRMCGVNIVPVLRGLVPVGILSFADVLFAATGPQELPSK